LIGKPDAWKLARPVWGWGQGETPWPTPFESPIAKNKNKISATVELGLAFCNKLFVRCSQLKVHSQTLEVDS